MRIALWGAVLAMVVSGCDNQVESTGSDETADETVAAEQSKVANRWYTPAQVRQGRQIYEANCASCHGADGQGAENWTQRKPNGNWPPPPLNGAGHSWHHPMDQLRTVISQGSPSGGAMPGWGDRLSKGEIDAVIAWFQHQWPEEAYQAWRRMDQGSR